MLDYAANGLKYWPVAELRADFEKEALSGQQDPTGLLATAHPNAIRTSSGIKSSATSAQGTSGWSLLLTTSPTN